MAKGVDLLSLAAQHVGEKYLLGAPVPKDNASWKGPWDCSEFVSWCIFQTSGRLYGCLYNDAGPAAAKAYTGAWGDDSRRLGAMISLLQAARTPGAAVLRYPQPAAHGHIVLSDGNGGAIEAKGRAFRGGRGVPAHRPRGTRGVLPGRWDPTAGAAAAAPRAPQPPE